MKPSLPSSVIALSFLALACAKDPISAPARITALPRALTGAEQRLIAADNRFALKLLRQVTADTRDTLPNLFVSPLSVAMALGMTYNGAAGTTEAAMRATLELEGMSVDEVNDAYRSLIALLRGLDPRVRFLIANSIWYHERYAVRPEFLDVNRSYYEAQVSALDFTSPTASQTINGWVERQTQGLIDAIVEPVLPRDARLYLINAIYFKGDWTQQFDRQLTALKPFRLTDGSSVNVPTMTHGKEVAVRVGHVAGVDVVDLPYGGRAFSMTIVLPRDSSVDALVTGLTAEQWNGWIAALDSTHRDVFLPKFKLENDLTLVGTLKALGMGVAFDPHSADFTRIHEPSELYISNVKHKTYVDVNEEGTEAAAVTSVEIREVSLPQPIVVDRPFLFALRENLSGTILFLGVIRNPAAGN